MVNDGALDSNVVTETIVVDPTNDTPVVTAASSANTFTEHEGPSDTTAAFNSKAITIDSGITVTNRDDSQEGDITRAVVEIVNDQAGDKLYYTDTAGVKLDSSSTATKLVLVATDVKTTTTTQFQAALQTVKYNNLSETPDNTDRQIKFTVTDADTAGEGAKSHSDTRIVKVNPTNDKPVIDMDNTSGANQPYTGSNSNIIDAVNKTATFDEMQGADTKANAQPFGAVITDLDATNLASVTVSVPASQVKRAISYYWVMQRLL